jgi:hypothetical protein
MATLLLARKAQEWRGRREDTRISVFVIASKKSTEGAVEGCVQLQLEPAIAAIVVRQ